MEFSASYSFSATPQAVWTLLNDPDAIAACLPGCERLEPIGEDRFLATLTLTVAAVSGRYTATVAILDKQPPHSYRLVVEGNGKAGLLKGEAAIHLVPQDDATVVTVAGQGRVGGLIARIGRRFVSSLARTMTDRFFSCLQNKATDG